MDKLNPLPNDEMLDVTRFKAFADAKLIFDKMTISLLDRVENTVEMEKMLIISVFQSLLL